MSSDNSDYSLIIEGDVLRFSTVNFRADRGSILHRGIYNHDLTALICATGFAILSFALARARGGFPGLIVSLVVFAAGFVFFRLVVFRKRELVLVADRVAGTMTVAFPFRKKRTLRISELLDMGIGLVTLAPENPEGVRFVEKIALHHYTVLPDFEKPLRLHTVELRMKDRTALTVYAGEKEAAESISIKMKGFLEIAETD